MNRCSSVDKSTGEVSSPLTESSVASNASGVWRLISDGAGEAAWNMAVDEALLNGVIANSSPPTIRLYRWRRPALTVGRFQNLSRTIDLDACRCSDVPMVRRITGGRGILHGNDLTISITATLADLGISKVSALEIYDLTAVWFVAALRAVGIEACSGSCTPVRGQERVGNCFDVVSRADIVDAATGRKVFGSALHRSGDAVLQQISIPVDVDSSVHDGLAARIFPHTMRTSFGYVPISDGNRPATSVQFIEHLVEVLQNVLVAVEPHGVLTGLEQVDAMCLLRSRYERAEWNLEGVQIADAGSN